MKHPHTFTMGKEDRRDHKGTEIRGFIYSLNVWNSSMIIAMLIGSKIIKKVDKDSYSGKNSESLRL